MNLTRAIQCLCGILAIAALSAVEAAEPAAKATALSAADQKFLDGLLAKQLLFDPKGAQYVRVKTTCRTVWATAGEIQREGWLVPGQDGKTARICFTDGESIAAPSQNRIEKLDFVAECRKRYAETKKPTTEDEDFGVSLLRMVRTALGQFDESDLALAAWLYRLDQPELAAKALERARREPAGTVPDAPPHETDEARMVRLVKEDLAWKAFAAMVHAYMVRADDETTAHGEHLLRLYPDIVKTKYAQAEAIVDALKQRKVKGTFGKAPPETWPEGFDSWDQNKKIAWLIDSLEEVDARQQGQPGGVPLETDRRVAALIEIGDPAVPALIDAVEKDGRLTRSVHFSRDFGRSYTVLTVRDAAFTAVVSILKVNVSKRDFARDYFTWGDADWAAKTVQRLRDYWKTYGSLPFDERMMKTLTDPKLDYEWLREAAHNLGSLGEKQTLTTVVGGWLVVSAKQPNPAVAKFAKPTVAEAILAAMDRDLADYDAHAGLELRLRSSQYRGQLPRPPGRTGRHAHCGRACPPL